MSPIPGRRKFLVLTDGMLVLGIPKVYFFWPKNVLCSWLTIQHLLFLSIQNVLCFRLTAHSIFVLCRPDLSCSWFDGMFSFLGIQNICPRRTRRLLLLARQNVLSSGKQNDCLGQGYSIRLLFRTRQNVHCSYS
jgi:hypothetical protein